MANPEQLAKLREGAEVWNRWRNEHPKVDEIDLTKADLGNAPLLWVDLSRANLRSAELYGANLSGANLDYANLEGASLFNANLTDTNLTNANLANANFYGTNLSRTDCTGANFAGAKFYDTIFVDTCLLDTKGLDTCKHYGPSYIDHRTLAQSGQLPLAFLRGRGLPDKLIEYLPSLLLDNPNQFYSVFISYSHADRPFARRLHNTLQGRGIRCWLDEKQLLPGQSLYNEIDRGIRGWDKFLLCCSENSLTSWWCNDEIEKVFDKELVVSTVCVVKH